MSVEEFEEHLRTGVDVYYARQTVSNASSILNICSSHILDGVIKNQKRILKNNQLKTLSLQGDPGDGKVVKGMLSVEEEDEFRDQGFTRPRVLIMTPFRNQAHDLIRLLAKQWTDKGSGRQVDGLKRLEEEFAGGDGGDLEVDKGDAFKWQFRGNIDDCYRIGIKCTRKAMKLFCEFYSSDIILASPLGLRLVIDGGVERTVVEGGGAKKRKRQAADSDFLSSIQLLIIDQADIMSMQNWDHLQTVMEHMNRIPKAAHDCDFTRVLKAFLDGKAAESRQTVLISAFQFPDLNALWSKCSRSEGWKAEQLISEETPFRRVSKKAKITFHTFTSSSLVDLPASRLEGFKKNFVDSLRKHVGTCIFVSSYFDFCQLRELLESKELSFVTLSEYTSTPDINRARSKFFNSQAHILLVTERFHFFRRYRIRGIKHLLFYSLPEYCEYFEEWVGALASEQVGGRVSVLVEPRYDGLVLERIVGREKAQRLLGIE